MELPRVVFCPPKVTIKSSCEIVVRGISKEMAGEIEVSLREIGALYKVEEELMWREYKYILFEGIENLGEITRAIELNISTK